jgi:hypothetical protein
MNRGVRIVALTVSHVAVFAVAAISIAGYRTRAAFQTAARDPLHRVALTMTTLRTDEKASSSLATELTGLSERVHPPTTDVIRLVAFLEQDRLAEAASTCAVLAWPRCDLQTLAEMRKVLAP